jgi:hypothetical protein
LNQPDNLINRKDFPAIRYINHQTGWLVPFYNPGDETFMMGIQTQRCKVVGDGWKMEDGRWQTEASGKPARAFSFTFDVRRSMLDVGCSAFLLSYPNSLTRPAWFAWEQTVCPGLLFNEVARGRDAR